MVYNRMLMFPQSVKMVSIKKLGIGGGVMFVVGILFGFVGFPALLRSQIKKVKRCFFSLPVDVCNFKCLT